MRILLALVEREMRERWHLPVAAALLGILALLSAWVPQAHSAEPAEVRSFTALVMSALLIGAAAIGLGHSMMARGLSEGRLAFYFARPVPAWSLWFGKLLATLLLLATSALLIWMPTLATGGGPGTLLVNPPDDINTFQSPLPWASRGRFIDPTFLLMNPVSDTVSPIPIQAQVVSGLVFLVLLTHIVSVMLRSASPRILLDLVALASLAGMAWSGYSRLTENEALGALMRSVPMLFGATLCALLAGGLVQTAVGRSSPARSHIALSATLWGLLLPFFGGFEILSRLVVRAGPEDLAQVTNVRAAPRGDWIVVAGPARGHTGYAPVFAHRPSTDETRKMDHLQALPVGPIFADNGGALVWQSCPVNRGKDDFCEVLYMDLATDHTPRHTGIRIPWHSERQRFASNLNLDAAGHRLALIDQGRLSVYEIPPRDSTSSMAQPPPVRTLVAVRLKTPQTDPDTENKSRGFFSSPHFLGDRVRVFRTDFDKAEVEVQELDLASRRMSRLGQLPGVFHERAGDQLATWGLLHGARVFLASDLSLLASFDSEGQHLVDDVRFLSDSGWIVAEQSRTRSSRLRRFDAQGQELWSLESPDTLLTLGLEESPGRLWTGFWQWQQDAEQDPPDAEGSAIPKWIGSKFNFESRLLDLETGRVLLRKPGHLPNWQPAPAGQPATRLLFGPRGVPTSIHVPTSIKVPAGQVPAGQVPAGHETEATAEALLELLGDG